MTGIIIGSLLLLIIIAGALFINLSPQFGGKPSAAEKDKFRETGHYANGRFINLDSVEQNMTFRKGMEVLWQMIIGVPGRSPADPIPVEKIDPATINKDVDHTRLTWFGHSAFLLEVDHKKLLIDPMFGDVPAPHPMLGSSRFSEELPIAIEALPPIDAVLISHDHYDHLDYGSIRQLKDKVGRFYVPLGVGAHLRAWNVEETKIHELAWWDEMMIDNIRLVAAPAQHFSGRSPFDRNTTLWTSYIIHSADQNIYFSGDGGYGPHFKEIGEKYGPFDFAMLECGQYNIRWQENHMLPEEVPQAAIDLGAKVMMPIHWGAFTLALHSWTDPVERVTKKAGELGVPVATPKIGEPVVLNGDRYPNATWWK